jgi:hypothetical protein
LIKDRAFYTVHLATPKNYALLFAKKKTVGVALSKIAACFIQTLIMFVSLSHRMNRRPTRGIEGLIGGGERHGTARFRFLLDATS